MASGGHTKQTRMQHGSSMKGVPCQCVCFFENASHLQDRCRLDTPAPSPQSTAAPACGGLCNSDDRWHPSVRHARPRNAPGRLCILDRRPRKKSKDCKDGSAPAHEYVPWYTMRPSRINMTLSNSSYTSGGGCSRDTNATDLYVSTAVRNTSIASVMVDESRPVLISSAVAHSTVHAPMT